MEIKIGNIEISVYNDRNNPASYVLQQQKDTILLTQKDMEILVSTLKPLVKQNKSRK